MILPYALESRAAVVAPVTYLYLRPDDDERLSWPPAPKTATHPSINHYTQSCLALMF